MKFAFNPESNIERDLLDRCIEGSYTVAVTLNDDVTRLDPVRICRRNALLTITTINLVDDGNGGLTDGDPITCLTLDCDTVDLIYIH